MVFLRAFSLKKILVLCYPNSRPVKLRPNFRKVAFAEESIIVIQDTKAVLSTKPEPPFLSIEGGCRC